MPRGRKKGSAATAAALVESVSAAPKRRGRPKGSKNKPKTVEAAVVKRGPGRPKGSASKASVVAAPALAAEKRGPGRPKAVKRRKRRTRKVGSQPVGRPQVAGVANRAVGGRIDALIAQLEAIKAEVRQLEEARDVLRGLPRF